MDRRNFLRTLVSAAASGLVSAAQAGRAVAGPAPGRVVIIGAGIVGSSIAWHLARRGCEVTVVEARGPAAQASGNSFAWLNGGDASQPPSYHLLRAYALGEHRRIGQELKWPVRWGGSLEWQDGPATDIDANVRLVQHRGSAMRVIDTAELAAIEPGLAVADGTRLVYGEQDGALDPRAATRLLFDSCQAMGATAVLPARVTGLDSDGNRHLVRTDAGTIDADLVVVAAGVDATAIARMGGLHLPQQSTPGVIVTTEPMDRIVHTVLYGPDVHVHQRGDGRVVLGEKAGPPQTDEHRALLAARPNEFPTPDLAAEHATRVLGVAQRQLPALARARVEGVGVGWRPMPVDGLPVVGRPRTRPGLYFAVMHSGITLAPLIGRLAATEILDGVELELLSDFRIDRLAGS